MIYLLQKIGVVYVEKNGFFSNAAIHNVSITKNLFE